MLSNPTFTACGACEEGQFADTVQQVCVDCPQGSYAPSAQEGACLACGEGMFTNALLGATQCSPCSAGRFSTAGTNAGPDGCQICERGTYSSYGQYECASCEPGRYAEHNGSTTCSNCPARRYSTLQGPTPARRAYPAPCRSRTARRRARRV